MGNIYRNAKIITWSLFLTSFPLVRLDAGQTTPELAVKILANQHNLIALYQQKTNPKTRLVAAWTKQLIDSSQVTVENKSQPTLVGACNAETAYDALLVIDEAVAPHQTGYDTEIHRIMHEKFPDLDGVLKILIDPNGTKSVAVVGKKFRDRFGYIYHPHYTTTVAKKELYESAALLGKLCTIEKPLFLPATKSAKANAPTTAELADEEIYRFRKQALFNLNPTTGEKIKLSILIPTLEKRRDMFTFIYNKLLTQIRAAGLVGKAEIVYNCDNGEKKTGTKRNELLQASRGEYTCFVDDDDDVANDFVERLYTALKKHPDCLTLEGIITFNGLNPRTFIHSTMYKSYFELHGIYYRPPNHLNPVRRDIAVRFQFPDKFISEDSEWAMQVCRSGLLKNEITPGKGAYYFYKYNDKNSVQSQPGR